MKIIGPDYEGMDRDAAAKDFLKRIAHYQGSYEPLCEEHDRELSFIKIYDQGEKFLVNRAIGTSSAQPLWTHSITICLASVENAKNLVR